MNFKNWILRIYKICYKVDYISDYVVRARIHAWNYGHACRFSRDPQNASGLRWKFDSLYGPSISLF